MTSERSVKLVNLTGHVVRLTDGNDCSPISPETRKARVQSKIVEKERVRWGGMLVPILTVEKETIIDLPDPADGVLYIVSGLVAARSGRTDALIPSRKMYDAAGVFSARSLLGMGIVGLDVQE
jgi:hypothetical protein